MTDPWEYFDKFIYYIQNIVKLTIEHSKFIFLKKKLLKMTKLLKEMYTK